MRTSHDSWLPEAGAIFLILFFLTLAYFAWRESQPIAVLEHPYICQGNHCWIQETWVLQ